MTHRDRVAIAYMGVCVLLLLVVILTIRSAAQEQKRDMALVELLK